MKKIYAAFFVFVAFMFPGLSVGNSEREARGVVITIVENIASGLENANDENANGESFYNDLVMKWLFPVIDFDFVGRLLTGKKIWFETSEEQQKRLINAFTRQLIDGYARYIWKITELEIAYLDVPQPKRYAIVAIQAYNKARPEDVYRVDFIMKKGEVWKVIDVRLDEDVSMMKVFRDSYAETLRNEGVAGLISDLERGVRVNAPSTLLISPSP